MRIKVVLVLALIAVLFASLTVETLSSYTVASSFGISIKPDTGKILRQAATAKGQDKDRVTQTEQQAVEMP